MWFLLAACQPAPEASTPATESPTTTSPTEEPEAPGPVALVVSSYFADKIHRFELESGAFIDRIDDLDGPQTLVVMEDGSWIACSELADQLVRIDPALGEVVGVVVGDDPGTPEDESGGLVHPDGVALGPDGRLYVSSFETDQVLRYEADGAFVDVFVAAGAGELDGPDLGIGFDPDGNLVVPGWYSDRVHRYDGATGAPLPDLVPAGAGLDGPREVRWTADGAAYVSGAGSDGLLRVDPATGAVEPFADLPGATGFAIDEAAGLIYAAGRDDAVHVLDLATGEELEVRVDFDGMDGATSVEIITLP